MGLFDKRDKKRGGKDDFDSPVEQIDLSSVAPATPPRADVATGRSAPLAPTPAPGLGKPADTAAAKPSEGMPIIEVIQEKPERREKKPMRGTPEHDDYGIDRAIELMRTLPSDNIELVVQVVKFSLESVGIKLPMIIEDAIRRQKDIQGRIGVLRTEIADLEQEIKVRREEIERLDADHKETSTVRERLELAESLGKPKPDGGGAVASAATTSSSGAVHASSQNIPRVTRQTAPPPAGLTSPTSPTGPTGSTSGPIASQPGPSTVPSPIKK